MYTLEKIYPASEGLTGLEHTTHSKRGPGSPFKLVGVLVPLLPFICTLLASLLPAEKGVSERCPIATPSLPFVTGVL